MNAVQTTGYFNFLIPNTAKRTTKELWSYQRYSLATKF